MATSSTPLNPSPGPNDGAAFSFPSHHAFPPFYTLQPNQTTLLRQLSLWSALIQSYCAHNNLFKLSLSAAATSPLFSNTRIHRSLDALSIRRVLDFMASPEGDSRAEWVNAVAKKGAESEKNTAWIWWRRPEEWAERILGWVDETGQKGVVLTVYELRESDAVANMDWVGMDEDQLRRCLDVLVRRGKAQIFGQTDGAGVKFF